LIFLVPPLIIGGMGYAARFVTIQVRHWIDKGWLPLGGKIIDLGSQEFGQDPAQTRDDVRDFLSGIPGAKEPRELTVPAIFRAAGFEYVSIDVDGQHGSQYFDLNSFAVPSQYLGRFDFVNNQGTIEHLANPINGFHAAHDMAKVHGVIRHGMPLIRWRRHGLFYPTVKFYDRLRGANRYELLRARVTILSVSEPFGDAFVNEIVDQTGGRWSANAEAAMDVVYRKTSDKPFEIPTDHLHHLPAETREKIARDLGEYYRELAQHRRVP